MNKKLLSIAVAAAMVAPVAASADTTIYGLIDTGLVYTDYDADGTADDTSNWDVKQGNGSSRLGFMGSEDLGGGMKATWHLEFGLDTSEGTLDGNQGDKAGESNAINNRLAVVGLTGGFGTVALGRQWTPYYQSVAKTNIMNVAGFHNYYGGTSRTGNAVAYVTPNMGGFQAKAAMIADGYDSDDAPKDGEENVDAYNISLDYSNGPIFVGVSFLEFGDNESNGVPIDHDRWGIGGSYDAGMVKISAEYEDLDDDENTDVWALGVQVPFGNNLISAVYGQRDGELKVGSDYIAAELDQWAIGLQHNFSKRTRVYVEYGQQEIDGVDSSDDADTDTFGIGLRHNF